MPQRALLYGIMQVGHCVCSELATVVLLDGRQIEICISLRLQERFGLSREFILCTEERKTLFHNCRKNIYNLV